MFASDGAGCILMLVSGGKFNTRLVADDIKPISSYFPKWTTLVCCRGSRADGDGMWQGIFLSLGLSGGPAECKL